MPKLPETEILDTGTTKYILFRTHDYVGRVLRTKGRYEPELQAAASRLLEGIAPGVVLDVGANIGTFAIPLAQKFPAHRFECFEVQRVVHHQLCGNIVLNGLNNARAHDTGISDAAAQIEVALPDYGAERNIMGFSLDSEVRRHDYACVTVGETDVVSVAPLDSFAFNDVRLIKIDVEGLELKVLHGAKDTLARNRFPPLIFEAWTQTPWYEQRRNELLSHVRSLGYEITEVGMNNIGQHADHRAPVRFVVQGPP
ncbi:MAG: FkbM family methyltransferase [Rhodospirillaceae bacterium]